MQNSLSKLYPQETKVKLEKLDHVFTVKKIPLKTDAWIEQEFGSAANASKLITEGNVVAIMKFFFSLLEYEDKVFLKELKIELDMDEEGNSREVSNLVEKLLYICGVNDIEAVVTALLKARGLSSPEPEIGDELGKNQKRGKKK